MADKAHAEENSQDRIKRIAEQHNTNDIRTFMDAAGQDGYFEGAYLGENEVLFLEYFISNKSLDFKHISETENYFWDQNKNRFVPYILTNFQQLFKNNSNVSPNFINSMFKLIYFYKFKKDIDRDGFDLLNNSISFKNGAIVYDKTERKLAITKPAPSLIYINRKRDIKHVLDPKVRDYMLHLANHDEELYEYLWYVLASILMPNSMVEKIYYFYGKGSLGKSELVSVIEDVIGSANTSNINMDKFCLPKGKVPYELENIVGKILNRVDELEKRPIDTSGTLKQFASGKSGFSIDIKQTKPISFTPKAKLIVNTNEIPNITSFDSGDKRRNVIIPFTGKKFSPTFDFSFLKSEEILNNIFNEMLKRAMYLSEHIHLIWDPEFQPECVKEATSRLKMNEEIFAEYKMDDSFWEDNRKTIIRYEHKLYVRAGDMLSNFNDYLKDEYDKPKMSIKQFLMVLKDNGIIDSSERQRIRLEGKRVSVHAITEDLEDEINDNKVSHVPAGQEV